jgi:hypothetical protein
MPPAKKLLRENEELRAKVERLREELGKARMQLGAYKLGAKRRKEANANRHAISNP